MKRQIKLSATNISNLLDQNCVRKTVFDTFSEESLKDYNIKKNHEINPKYSQLIVNKLLFREGTFFEQDIYDGLETSSELKKNNIEIVFVRPKDGKTKYGRLGSEDLIPFIKTPPDISKLFFQVTIPISENFVLKYIPSIDSALLKKDVAIIDLLFYNVVDNTWYIIDIKKSEAITNSHRFQIAFYWMVLENWIVSDLKLSAIISKLGYVKLKGSESSFFLGDQFDIKPFIDRVSDFLCNQIPKSLNLDLNQFNWHLIYSCEKCNYFLHCRNDSKENRYISELPFLSKTAKQFLNDHEIIYLKEGFEKFNRDEHFGNESSSIKKERDLIVKRLENKINYLENPEEFPSDFIRNPCYDMPNPIYLEYPMFISAEKEYLHGYVYQISILYRDRNDNKLPSSFSHNLENLNKENPENPLLSDRYYFKSFIMEEPTPEEQIRILQEFLLFTNRILDGISKLDESLANHKRTVHFFFLDKVDLKNIYSSSLKYSIDHPDLLIETEKLLSFFPPTQDFIDDTGDPDLIWNVPYTILSSVIRKVLILPVESTGWLIQDVWRDENKNPYIKVRKPSKRYLRDISNQYTLLFASDYWKRNKFVSKETEEGKLTLKTLLEYKTRLCMQIYWKLSELNQKEQPNIFILFKPPLANPRKSIPKSDNLEQLAEDLILNLPEDDFIRPLNYFQSCENLNESIKYFKDISSNLQERITLGIALGNISFVGAIPLKNKKERGFLGKFVLNGLNTSKFSLKKGLYILTDKDSADLLYSKSYKEKKAFIIEIREVNSKTSTIEISAKIPGNIKGIIKHPFFQNIKYSREGVKLDELHKLTTYVLDKTKGSPTSNTIDNFLTSFAYLRLSNQFPEYLAKLIAPTSITEFNQIDPKQNTSNKLVNWENYEVLIELTNFNLKQREAINSVMLGNTLNLVWGPPGTGKTRVIAWSIIISLFNNRYSTSTFDPLVEMKKIAVTAFTNRAIDNALEKLIEALKSYNKQTQSLDLGEIVIIRAVSKKRFIIYTDIAGSLTSTEPEDIDYYYDLIKDDYTTVIVFGTVFQLNHFSDDEELLTEIHNQIHNRRSYIQYKIPTQIFDLIIVDESSQLKVTEFFMSSFTLKKDGIFLIVGDDKQLSPVVIGEYPDSFIEKVGSIYSYFKDILPKIEPIMLTQTYRFSSNIAEFPSQSYYNNQLFSKKTSQELSISDEAKNSYLYSILNDSKEIILITYNGVLRAQDNEIEAEICAIILDFYSKFLEKDNRPLHDYEFQDKIGLITPHNAQINAITNEVIKRGISESRIPVIETVDKYQGQEREIIIISYGVSDTDYAESEIEFILSPNRFNVSITRPEKKYIILISEDLINILPEDEELIKYAFLFQDYKNSFENRIEDFFFKLGNGNFKTSIYY